MPEFAVAAMLFAAGVLAGVLNAVAGGGSFVTFPALLATGIAPLAANATNALAVWPGHALAVFADRRELRDRSRGTGASMLAALAGAAAGALLLDQVGNERFRVLIPWLILFATLLFAFGPRLQQRLAARAARPDSRGSAILRRAAEFTLAVYGGFFGAGLGVMLMAGLQMLGHDDIRLCNSLKNLLATVIGTMSVAVLLLTGWVSLWHAAWPFAGAVIGGLAGARLARMLPARWLRAAVVLAGVALCAHYFRQP